MQLALYLSEIGQHLVCFLREKVVYWHEILVRADLAGLRRISISWQTLRGA